MTAVDTPLFAFESTYAEALEELCVAWRAEPLANPSLLTFNDQLALELGVEPAAARTADGIGVLLGQRVPPGSVPVALGYAGHQFGGYSPRLGDGRALLLGEVVDVHGRRRDVHLKGSGRTPFARGGDGKAAVGPMLREHVVSEAMYALGIPTTRALAVAGTGEIVRRETPLPGAVLVRVAASHIRVGTFQYAASHHDDTLIRRLADYAIARHYPHVADTPNPYLALFEAVLDAQAALVAKWMLVGFVHGVMNTDNMTISGETIDYGPCAFIDAFDPTTVFSSIDHGGRYAYGNQPTIAQWNLARLAETLLTLIHADQERAVAAATDVLNSFPERYEQHWLAGMRTKLGLPADADREIVDSLLTVLRAQRVDYTSFFRALADTLRGDDVAARLLFAYPTGFAAWRAGWRQQANASPDEMDRVNPIYIPRNHLVEAALEAATAGDLTPFERLLDAVTSPFVARPDRSEFADPPPATFGRYTTYCGT